MDPAYLADIGNNYHPNIVADLLQQQQQPPCLIPLDGINTEWMTKHGITITLP